MSIYHQAPDHDKTPDDDCPWCAGRDEGQWMDLCDDHLREWLRPALDRSPGGDA